MATSISRIIVHRVPLQLRTPFTTSFGTYETLDRPFVVIETSDGLRGVGEIPTLLDPAYKAEVDTPVRAHVAARVHPAERRALSARAGSD